jgi:hypothetical protein
MKPRMNTSNPKRHQRDKKTFEELSFAEQAKAINAKVLWFLSATQNHIKKCTHAHGSDRATKIPQKVAQQLRSMAARIEHLATPTTSTFTATEKQIPEK